VALKSFRYLKRKTINACKEKFASVTNLKIHEITNNIEQIQIRNSTNVSKEVNYRCQDQCRLKFHQQLGSGYFSILANFYYIYIVIPRSFASCIKSNTIDAL